MCWLFRYFAIVCLFLCFLQRNSSIVSDSATFSFTERCLGLVLVVRLSYMRNQCMEGPIGLLIACIICIWVGRSRPLILYSIMKINSSYNTIDDYYSISTSSSAYTSSISFITSFIPLIRRRYTLILYFFYFFYFFLNFYFI